MFPHLRQGRAAQVCGARQRGPLRRGAVRADAVRAAHNLPAGLHGVLMRPPARPVAAAVPHQCLAARCACQACCQRRLTCPQACPLLPSLLPSYRAAVTRLAAWHVHMSTLASMDHSGFNGMPVRELDMGSMHQSGVSVCRGACSEPAGAAGTGWPGRERAGERPCACAADQRAARAAGRERARERADGGRGRARASPPPAGLGQQVRRPGPACCMEQLQLHAWMEGCGIWRLCTNHSRQERRVLPCSL